MQINAGYIEVEPSQRDAFLAQLLDNVKTSQAEDGCIEYVMSADPINPDRVRVFEVWESTEHHRVHMERMMAPRPADAPARIPYQSIDVVYYDVSGTRRRGS
jgi:quinol monooxygenase YgiN